MSEPCPVCGPVVSVAIVFLAVWVPLMVFTLIRLRRLPFEMLFYGWGVAGAATLVISVVGALLPDLFFYLQFDITTVYLAGFLGAVALLWFTLTRFWREINLILRRPETDVSQQQLSDGESESFVI